MELWVGIGNRRKVEAWEGLRGRDHEKKVKEEGIGVGLGNRRNVVALEWIRGRGHEKRVESVRGRDGEQGKCCG